MGLQQGIQSALRSVESKIPTLRKGRVKNVDTSGTWDRVTVDPGGVEMVTLVAVSVDDVVVWISGPLPVCLGTPYSTP